MRSGGWDDDARFRSTEASPAINRSGFGAAAQQVRQHQAKTAESAGAQPFPPRHSFAQW